MAKTADELVIELSDISTKVAAERVAHATASKTKDDALVVANAALVTAHDTITALQAQVAAASSAVPDAVVTAIDALSTAVNTPVPDGEIAIPQ